MCRQFTHFFSSQLGGLCGRRWLGFLSRALATRPAWQRAEDCGARDPAQAARPHPPGPQGQPHLTH